MSKEEAGQSKKEGGGCRKEEGEQRKEEATHEGCEESHRRFGLQRAASLYPDQRSPARKSDALNIEAPLVMPRSQQDGEVEIELVGDRVIVLSFEDGVVLA